MCHLEDEGGCFLVVEPAGSHGLVVRRSSIAGLMELLYVIFMLADGETARQLRVGLGGRGAY